MRETTNKVKPIRFFKNTLRVGRETVPSFLTSVGEKNNNTLLTMKGLYMDRIPVQLVVDYKMSVALILSFIYWNIGEVRRSHIKEMMQWSDVQVTTVVDELVGSGVLIESDSRLLIGEKVIKYFEVVKVYQAIVESTKHITPSPFVFSRGDFLEGEEDPEIKVQNEVALWFKSGQKEVPTQLLASVQTLSKDHIKRFCRNKIKERVGEGAILL